jgi:prepilin-type N-terminal cleavage/methylation domain-containing protein
MRRARAFTLIEMVVVVGIVLILMALMLVTIMAVRRHQHVKDTGMTIHHIESALTLYQEKFADTPPSNGDLSGISGAENLFEALNTKEFKPLLRDTPTCSTPSGKTVFADAWNHPIRYLHHKDYDNKPPNKLEYRLISAGLNGTFEHGAADSDDIGNWGE